MVELYGGILAGARAVELLSMQITGTLYSESDKDSVTVATHRWPNSINLGATESINGQTIIAALEAHPNDLIIVIACLPKSADAEHVIGIVKEIGEASQR